MSSYFQKISLKVWHGGGFKTVANGELVYERGRGRTKSVDPDELSYFDLIELAKECSNGKAVEDVLYLIPGLSLCNGLRRINNDNDAVEVASLGRKYRVVELYVLHAEDDLDLDPQEPEEQPTHFQPLLSTQASQSAPQSSKPQQLKPKRGPPQNTLLTKVRSSPRKKQTPQPELDSPSKKRASSTSLQINEPSPTPSLRTSSFLAISSQKTPVTLTSSLPTEKPTLTSSLPTEKPSAHPEPHADLDFDWYDDRPDSPIPLNDLIPDYSDSDEQDPAYDPRVGKGKGVAVGSSKQEAGVFGEVYTDVETESDEFDVEDETDVIDEVDLEKIDLEIEEEFDEALLVDDLHSDSDVSDDEFVTAKERVKACNNHLVELAQQKQREAAKGKAADEEVLGSVSEDQGAPSLSEYEESDDEALSPAGSDEDGDEVRRRRAAAVLVSPDADFSHFQWRIGLRFAKREDFREAVTKYAVVQGKDLTFTVGNKNRQQRLGVKCSGDCPFYIYASWHSRKASYIVKRAWGKHTCNRTMKKNRQLKDKWVAQQFLDVFKTRPHWPARKIVDCIRRAFKVIVTREFAYRVKYAAHKLLHGSMYEHYQKVRGYLAALESCSPGSHSELVTVMPKQPPPIFQRLYICFDGLAKGWIEGCRKVLAIDGCFLKTFLGGQLFCAVGRDSNDQMFPVAWAVTEGENSLSWEWFLKHLQTSLELGDGTGLAILSDEHQAILSGVSSVLPQAEHRHCARHVYANWSKSYRGDEFKLQFWKIAKCYNQADYDEALDELSVINVEVALAFKAHNPQHFCRAFLSTDIKTDAITSNIAETFNGYIINARTKHLLHMLEDIRSNLMHRMVQKRQLMDKCTSVLCPRIQTKLNQEKDKAAMCEVLPSTMTLFNVTCFTDQVVVNLETMTCTCRKWDMLGIPCKHAIACIFFLNKEAEDFVHKCYTKESYMRAYAGSIPPLVGERYWPKVTYQLQPPPIKIGPGRPRKKRVKDPYENPKKPGVLTKTGVEMTCSLCNVKGHNKRKCPEKGKIVQLEPAPKRHRGRPRADGQPSQQHQTSEPLQPQQQTAAPHHTVSAQPTQLGKGGRAIRGGRGSRAGQTAAAGRGQDNQPAGRGQAPQHDVAATEATGGRGQGRGDRARGSRGRTSRGRGRSQQPRGVGVLFAEDGSVTTNVTRGASTHRSRSSRTVSVNQRALNYLIMGTQPSQQSTLTQHPQ